MSSVIAAPEQVESAAQDLAGIRSALGEAAASVAAPTTGVVSAAADEVSAAISALFGNFGQHFQSLSAQAQAFHAEFVKLIKPGARAYVSTEIANAEQALANAVSAPASAIPGTSLVPSGAVTRAAQSVSAAGLLGGGSGGSLLGGLTCGTGGLGGLLGGLTGAGGLGLLGGLGSLGGNLNSLLPGTIPGLAGALTGLENSLTPVVNSLLPGLVNIQTGTGPYFADIWGPYEALF